MATSKCQPSPRANYVVEPNQVAAVLTHRTSHLGEEYLIRWKTPGPASAEIVSWNSLSELRRCLVQIQEYLARLPERRAEQRDSAVTLPGVLSKKRKSPHDETPSNGYQLFSNSVRGNISNGFQSLKTSTSRSSASSSRSSVITHAADNGPRIYNGLLSKRAGVLIPKRGAPQVDANQLPTQAMREVAFRTPTPMTERELFLEKLKPLKGVTLENEVDDSTPSLNFTFIKEYVLGEGVTPQDPSTFEGCTKCKPDMGQNVGCEYTQKCGCLEYAGVNEKALARNPEMHAEYLRVKEHGGFQRPDLPKRFPYTKPSSTGRPQTLAAYYLEDRHAIYECNDNCACGPRCKSRLVQKGRRVPLTIFMTPNGYWGLKCGVNLLQGQFIDTYLGEVITHKETNRREAKFGQEKTSYLYSLDKFLGDTLIGENRQLEWEDCYVVDGQFMGNATRFINHSCEPNCRQYTVSYDKNNIMLYHLAFFAYKDIPAGTELTFDYMDEDELEVEDAILKREQTLSDPANRDILRCKCGSIKCRGIMWNA